MTTKRSNRKRSSVITNQGRRFDPSERRNPPSPKVTLPLEPAKMRARTGDPHIRRAPLTALAAGLTLVGFVAERMI